MKNLNLKSLIIIATMFSEAGAAALTNTPATEVSCSSGLLRCATATSQFLAGISGGITMLSGMRNVCAGLQQIISLVLRIEPARLNGHAISDASPGNQGTTSGSSSSSSSTALGNQPGTASNQASGGSSSSSSAGNPALVFNVYVLPSSAAPNQADGRSSAEVRGILDPNQIVVRVDSGERHSVRECKVTFSISTSFLNCCLANRKQDD